VTVGTFTLPDTSAVEAMSAEEILELCVDEFGDKVSLACSFQKEEAVLLDMLLTIDPKARVFALDTHVLFPETYKVWREVEKRYDTKVEVYEGPSLGRQAAIHGDALWASKPDLCCAIRKVAPLNRALAELDCWVTGMRRDQSPTRANAPKLGWDETHELWKANPLAGWTDELVWAYIHERDLPYNQLHDSGYASIGCTHCTVPGAGREGRWAGRGKVECGLHAALEQR
jgi:phosphoadenosine phosphosulfate reductase